MWDLIVSVPDNCLSFYIKLYFSHVMILWYFSSSSSKVHAQPSSRARYLIFSRTYHLSILHVCEQRRLWRDCTDAQARLSLRWSPI